MAKGKGALHVPDWNLKFENSSVKMICKVTMELRLWLTLLESYEK